MDNTLNTRSRSKIEGLSTLTDNNGTFDLSSSFDDVINIVDANPVTFNDSTTQEVEILYNRKLKNGIEGIENELLVNQEIEVILEVDVTGELIMSDFESQKYIIDDNAELIFNFE